VWSRPNAKAVTWPLFKRVKAKLELLANVVHSNEDEIIAQQTSPQKLDFESMDKSHSKRGCIHS
jgi:hypothetical protein